MYQLVVGEIGRDRRDTIYNMTYSDILLIIRGYRRRNVLQYQFQRLQAYHSLFAFRENKDGKLPEQIWPLYFDRYKMQQEESKLTEEDIDDMMKDMEAYKRFCQEEFSNPKTP